MHESFNALHVYVSTYLCVCVCVCECVSVSVYVAFYDFIIQ